MSHKSFRRDFSLCPPWQGFNDTQEGEGEGVGEGKKKSSEKITYEEKEEKQDWWKALIAQVQDLLIFYYNLVNYLYFANYVFSLSKCKLIMKIRENKHTFQNNIVFKWE